MDRDIETVVGAIHDSPVRCVLHVTGGGSRALAYLLCVPGASRTVLEATVPYSEASLTELLGRRPDHALSAEVATALARRAHERATAIDKNRGPQEVRDSHGAHAVAGLFGVGCTAGLATDRPRRGPHCCYVGVCGEGGVVVRSLALAKGARIRDEEEEVVARLVLNTLAETCGVEARVDLALLDGENVQELARSA